MKPHRPYHQFQELRHLFLLFCMALFGAFTSLNLQAQDCVTPPADVDAESEAYAQVIQNDSFCCDIDWDVVCQNAYNNIINNGGDSGCAANIPGDVDTDSEAFATVIANEPSCCNFFWGISCQYDYDLITGVLDCVEPPADVDTESEAYASVIANDLFCCDYSWDFICQNAYDSLIGNTGGGGNECADTPATIDTNSEAYATVIANDPFCCTATWDAVCQNNYDELIGNPGGGGEDECVEAPSEVDTDSEAYATVIANDSFCCTFNWDFICQNAYNELVGNGGGGGADDCVQAPDSVDTDSEEYATVIANDPFCCSNVWDVICQLAYDELLGNPGGGGGDECVEVPATVDAGSEAYAVVIANDPLCCSSVWDAICQDAYDAIVGNPGGGTCVEPPASVDTDSEAYATVIANDAFCCNTSWDVICQNAYDAITGNTGGAGACIEPPASIDTDSEAYAYVISYDPFCCNFGWDYICQSSYNSFGMDMSEEEDGFQTWNCVSVPEYVDNESEEYAEVIANDPFCCNNAWDFICQNAYEALDGPGIAPYSGDLQDEVQAEDLSLSVYPNPTAAIANASLKGIHKGEEVFLAVFDLSGKMLLQKRLFSDVSENLVQIDVNSLAPGMYLVKAQSGERAAHQTFVKM